jgi:hypothetical protein
MFVEFGEYLPDLPDFQNPGATVAKNVIPSGKSYQPFLSPTVYSNALSARCQGAVSTKDKDGNTVNFAGDAAKLYKSASAVYSDVSLAGGYTVNNEENWQFTRFGDRLIATQIADYPQSYTLASSSNFANLTTAVKARYCATIRSFLVLGNTWDAGDTYVPHRVRWSALDDSTDFTVSATTQSDYQDLNPTNGWVRQVIGGEYGVIFQERAIIRMTYVGSPIVWQFDEVETGKGTQASNSVVKVGNLIFYLGLDGFYVFDGNQSVPIGENKVNKTFFAEVDLSYLSRIYGAADFDKQVIYWAYPASGNNNGMANKVLCYNYSPNSTKRWSYAEPGDLEFIYTSLSEGYTMDSLVSLYPNLDLMPISLDSRTLTGENFLLSGFNSSHKQVNFTGTALDALIETQEAQLSEGQRTYISRIRPVVDGSGTITAQIGTRNLLSESVTYATAVSVNSTGDCPVRSNARFHRVRTNITGGFNDAQGIEVLDFKAAGRR